MPTEFVLGPSLDSVIEPMPGTVPVPTVVAGRRGIRFQPVPTSPGGRVNVQFLPSQQVADALPLNVYAFFCQPVAIVPPSESRTADWFFKSGSPSSSAQSAARDSSDNLTVIVPNVTPSLQPWFVQTILEYSV